MKIFLIVPPNLHYIEPYAYIKADKSNTIRPCLGLLYVAAAVKDISGIDIRIIDANADELSLEKLEELITKESPDMVGFSVLTFNLLNCMDVSRIVRKCNPQTKICFGGWHPTLYPQETLAFDFVDFIVIGEGELTFTDLIKIFNNNKPPTEKELSGIKGLGYKLSDGSIMINPPREVVKNLDDLPLPAYDLLDTTKYFNLLACSGQSVNIMTSRGCPHRCVFCDLRRTTYRYRTPGNILEEINFWVAKGVQEFFIQDDNFTIDRKRTIEFCRLLTDANLNIKYKISSRVDCIDDEICQHLKKSGCYRIYFGVESGSQKVLDCLEKGITIQHIKTAFQAAHKHDIDCCAYVMIGVPSETEEDIRLTRSLLKDIKPNHLHCSICTPMPRTYLYGKLMEDGVITNDYWLDFAKKPAPSFKTPFASQLYSAEELRRMQNAIQKQFYLNPRIILHEILKTRGLKQFTAKSKMALKMLFH
jgi:anaerobic magnesium-protoporphyrin IX monomethyl ester cyclase